VRDLPRFLKAAGVLVLDDTNAINARPRGHRVGWGDTQARVEVMLHGRLMSGTFLGFVHSACKLAVADRLLLGDDPEVTFLACR
jgi:S-adenosylmethionine:tRNA-ribosyltransferase-isomerase (queuine synthetase)